MKTLGKDEVCPDLWDREKFELYWGLGEGGGVGGGYQYYGGENIQTFIS